jgi:type II secretory pathway predicted ATPase ExeA
MTARRQAGKVAARRLKLFRRAKEPVALSVDDAHYQNPKTLVALKRLAGRGC